MKKLFLIAFAILLFERSYSQSLAVNTTGNAANASAMVDISSTTKGMLIPRMLTTERTAISTPATGLIVYDTDLNQFYFWNGTSWTAIPTGANANNYWTLGAGNLYNNAGANVGIGITAPNALLDVTGTSGGSNSLLLRSGNSSASTSSNQISFSFNNTLNFRHAIKTRHNSGAQAGNAFDFYVWNQGIDPASGIGTKHIMSLDGTGFVGIGITTPISTLQVNNGNLLVNGTFGAGPAIEPSGAGTRMFFNPRKAAFRAGYINSTQWDDANVGNYSVAIGANGQAKTDYSVAIGEGNIAETGAFAVAIGRENHSTGFASLAMGHFSEATGDYSTSIGLRDTVSAFSASSLGGYNKVSGAYGFTAGFGNVVSANQATAFGISDTASGINSFVAGAVNKVSGSESAAIGNNNKVSGAGSVALGSTNTVTASVSMALGYQNTAGGYGTFVAGRSNTVAGNHSTAFGFDNDAFSDQAFVIGSRNAGIGANSFTEGVGNTAFSYGETTLGTYAATYSPTNITGFFTYDRAFAVGNGTSAGSRSNAIEVWKNGFVGINNVYPNSTLTVNGSVAYTVISTSVSMLLNETNYVVIYTGGAGNSFTFSPAASTGRIYRIINYGTGALTLPVYIDGNASTSTTLAAGGIVELINDGTNWIKIN